MEITEGWLIVICVFVLFVGAVAGFGLSQNAFVRDVEALGKVIVNDKVYECREVKK